MPSFTSSIPSLLGVAPVFEVKLAVGVVIENILRKNNQNVPTPVSALAMVDTGATRTVVRDDIIRQLGLNPVGMITINTPSSTNVQCYEYYIGVLFPNNVVIHGVIAIATPLQGQHIQCLIGRDVLSLGVFIYTGYMNTFTLSF